MKTKIEIKTICGSVIFEYEKENNSISETVKEYIKKELASGKSSANLRYANLRHADLSSANLRYADLRHADLSFANLMHADLSSANLRYADLSSANLSSANLSSARNLIYSACYFSGHGECGRQLLAVKIGEDVKLFCGCFSGTETELRDYIEKHDEELKSSRLIALETVLKLIEIKNGRE
jgi:hypothetical protein